MTWTYGSENLEGNLHDAARYINTYHPEWDVVAIESGGHYTVVVWRTIKEPVVAMPSMPGDMG